MAGPHTPDALAIAELLAARLCHELAGPVGALAGTLDLAVEDRDFDAVAAAQEQAAVLMARLRLLRAAWGDGEALDAPQLRALLAGLPRAGKVVTDLDGLEPAGRLSPAAARLLLNVLLLAGESLPRGGRVVVASAAAGVTVALQGARAAWPHDLATMLAADDTRIGMEPRHLQAPMTVMLARAAGIALTLASGDPDEPTPSLLIGV